MKFGPALEKFVRRRLPILYNPLLAVYQRLFDADTFRVRRHLRGSITSLEQAGRPLIFVQVGSNDGFSNDPFCDWVIEGDAQAYFFEPVPTCFDRLVSNYRSRVSAAGLQRLHFLNEAVTLDDDDLVFYSVSNKAVSELGSNLPYWWDQLGSFDRSHITKHLDGVLEPFIVETDVQTISLSSFVRREGLSRIDVLHIDAEGHDLKVLRSLDLQTTKPQLILIEHKHLSAEDKRELTETLGSAGYQIRQFQSDLIAEL